MLVLLSFYTSISTKYNASGKHEPVGEILRLPKYKIKVAIESVILSETEPSQSLCDSCLAAARSQNGSSIINAIHYRSAVSLPRVGDY